MAHHGRRKPKTGAPEGAPVKLRNKNSKRHWLLAIGIAIGVLAVAMLLKWLFTISIKEREVWMSKDAYKQS